jgi:hypothetical protein
MPKNQTLDLKGLLSPKSSCESKKGMRMKYKQRPLWFDICIIQIKEEKLKKQKSRVQWLTFADLNTNFFQLSTIIRGRRKKYIISFLKHCEGHWISGH